MWMVRAIERIGIDLAGRFKYKSGPLRSFFDVGLRAITACAHAIHISIGAGMVFHYAENATGL